MRVYLIRRLLFMVFLAPFTLVETAFACSDVSVDGCPTIADVDDNAAAIVGGWITSRVKLLWYGDDYEVVQGSGGAPTHSASFTAPVDTEVDGYYSVYARWTSDPNRCVAARHLIYDGAVLLATATRNQQQNGGAWHRLGTFRFTPNQTPRVVVDNGGCAGTYVVADGVRWVKEDNDSNSIVDEPGYDLSQSGSIPAANLAVCSLPSTSWTTLATVTLTTPRSHGIVWVHANGISRHFTDNITRVCIATSAGCTSLSPILDQSSIEVTEGAWDNETRWVLSDTFPATGASQTYYLRGCRENSTSNVDLLWDDVVGLYFPTQY